MRGFDRGPRYKHSSALSHLSQLHGGFGAPQSSAPLASDPIPPPNDVASWVTCKWHWRPTGPVAGRKSNRTSGNCLPPSPVWSVSQQMEHTPCTMCSAGFYYFIPFKQEHFSSAHHVSYGPVMHSLSSRGGSLNGFRHIPSNYPLCIPAHPPSL